MKKVFLGMIFSLVSFVIHAQTINVSTGISTSGSAISSPSPDPIWQIVNPTGLPTLVCNGGAFWDVTPIAITNAGWINTSGLQNYTNLVTGPVTYERTFAVAPGSSTIDCNFAIAADDNLLSLELVRPDNSTVPLTYTFNGYHLSLPITNSVPVGTMSGTWKIKAVVDYVDAFAAFLLSGNLTVVAPQCPTCLSDSISLNTGVDASYVPFTGASPDLHWLLTSTPTIPVATIIPQTVTPTFWATPSTAAKYINPTGAITSFNIGDYTYERSFEVCNAGDFLINYKLAADNSADVYIDGTLISSTIGGVYGFSLGNEATAINYVTTLTAGTHKIIAKVNNIGSITGLWVAGSVKPAPSSSGHLIPDICIPLVTCTATATNVSGCACKPIALVGSPAGGTFSLPNPYTNTVPGTYSYTYTYTDAATGCTATSAPATITVLPSIAPTLTVTASTISATVSWTPGQCLDRYFIWYREVGATSWLTPSVYAPTTSLNITGLLPGTLYEIKIRAINSCGVLSSFSPVINFTTNSDPCGTPATIISASATSIKWNEVPGAPVYNVYYKKTSSYTWSTYCGTGGTGAIRSFTPSGLGPIGTPCEVKIRNKCAGTCSSLDPWTNFGSVFSFASREANLLENVANSISIFPNPATDQINIEFDAMQSKSIDIKLVDLTGRLIKQTSLHTSEGLNQISIDIHDLSTGTYLVQLFSDNHLIKTTKVQKNN